MRVESVIMYNLNVGIRRKPLARVKVLKGSKYQGLRNKNEIIPVCFIGQ
jgi:hypothetical protein